MGRPTIITPEIQDAIVQALEDNNTVDDAALSAGIAPSTHYTWLKRGRDELDRLTNPKARPRAAERPFVEYAEAIARARATGRRLAVRALTQAATGWEENCGACGGTGRITTKEASTREGHQAQKTARAVDWTCKHCNGQGRIIRDPDWRAALTILERTDPQNWGRRQILEHQGSDTGPPVLTTAIVAGADDLTPEIAEKAHEFLRATRRAQTAPVDA